MKSSNLTRTNLIFICSALVLTALTFFSYQRINKQVRASDEVTKAQLLKFKLNDAFSHLLKTETSQRGFVLTGDSSFLYDYFLGRQPIPALLSEIQVLISNNAKQSSSLKSVTALFQTRLNHLDKTMAVREKISKGQLDSVLLKGKNITDELNNRIEQMITTEDQLLGERMISKQNEERNTSMLILLFSFLSIGILIIGFFRVKGEMLNNNFLQQKVEERTKEINAANEILNKQNIELVQKNDELSSFIFVANHDLKEPLRKIELFLSKIEISGELVSQENKKLFAKTVQCAKTMKALLEDVFIYTLTNKMTQFESIDLNEVVETCTNNLRDQIDEKEAKIECQHLPQINAIPLHMEQLFTNLLSNSLKYARKDVKPHIRIEAERKNDAGNKGSWIITFTDNGIGFEEVHREKIFEMFQRLHPKDSYAGTGIGLTICRKIVENHKGTITARSQSGKGAVFTISLPDLKTNTT